MLRLVRHFSFSDIARAHLNEAVQLYLVGQSGPARLLLAGDEGESTRIYLYNMDTDILCLLYTHAGLFKCVGASLDNQEAILAITQEEVRLKEGEMCTYFKTSLAEMLPAGKSYPVYVRSQGVQSVHFLQGISSPILYLFVIEGWFIRLYGLHTRKQAQGGFKILAQPHLVSEIVKKFVWYQWDASDERLYVLLSGGSLRCYGFPKKEKLQFECLLSAPTPLSPSYLGFRHFARMGRAPTRARMVKLLDGGLCFCFVSGDSLSVISVHHDECWTHVVAQQHPAAFLRAGDSSVAIWVPGQWQALVGCGLEHPPVLSLLSEGPVEGVTGDMSMPVVLSDTMLLDAHEGIVYGLELDGERLLDCVSTAYSTQIFRMESFQAVTALTVVLYLKAAQAGNVLVPTFDRCIQALVGANINTQIYAGMTPLHLAAEDGNMWAVKMLLEKGASINTQDHAGMTPLHLAAKDDNIWVVKLLLEKGASFNLKNSNGKVAQQVAQGEAKKMLKFCLALNQSKPWFSCLKLLESDLSFLDFWWAGAPVTNRDVRQRLSLLAAVKADNDVELMQLCNMPAPCLDTIVSGKNLLKLAEEWGSVCAVQYLKTLRMAKTARVLIVGEGGSGKTKLRTSMLGQEYTEGATHVMDIFDKQYKELGVQLQVVDFGGQEGLHAAQQLFLGRGGSGTRNKHTYVIACVDARKNIEKLQEELRLWLDRVKSGIAADEFCVFLTVVATHCESEPQRMGISNVTRSHSNVQIEQMNEGKLQRMEQFVESLAGELHIQLLPGIKLWRHAIGNRREERDAARMAEELLLTMRDHFAEKSVDVLESRTMHDVLELVLEKKDGSVTYLHNIDRSDPRAGGELLEQHLLRLHDTGHVFYCAGGAVCVDLCMPLIFLKELLRCCNARFAMVEADVKVNKGPFWKCQVCIEDGSLIIQWRTAKPSILKLLGVMMDPVGADGVLKLFGWRHDPKFVVLVKAGKNTDDLKAVLLANGSGEFNYELNQSQLFQAFDRAELEGAGGTLMCNLFLESKLLVSRLRPPHGGAEVEDRFVLPFLFPKERPKKKDFNWFENWSDRCGCRYTLNVSKDPTTMGWHMQELVLSLCALVRGGAKQERFWRGATVVGAYQDTKGVKTVFDARCCANGWDLCVCLSVSSEFDLTIDGLREKVNATIRAWCIDFGAKCLYEISMQPIKVNPAVSANEWDLKQQEWLCFEGKTVSRNSALCVFHGKVASCCQCSLDVAGGYCALSVERDVELGSGGQGQVYAGQHEATAEACAIKVGPRVTMEREHKALELLSETCVEGARVVQLLAATTHTIAGANWEALVLERVHGHPLQPAKYRSREHDVQHFLHTMAKLLQVIHAKGVYHLDIAPRNILADEDGSLVLVDFGVCAFADSVGMRGESGRANDDGRYVAPELFAWNPQANDSTESLAKCDVYSLGVVALQLFLGCGDTHWDLRPENAKVAIQLGNGSESFAATIAWMCNKDKTKRPTWDEVIEQNNKPYI